MTSPFNVVLDPVEVAIGRSEFPLNNGPLMIDQTGIDWGDAAISTYMADQRWGSTPIDFRVPNRIVTIPLFLGADDAGTFETTKRQLQQKVGLLQREGGSLLRGDTGWYADIESATLTLPDVYGPVAQVEPNVKLVLECLPDFYGDEETLDAITGTGLTCGVLSSGGTAIAVQGDHGGRVRIRVTDTSGHNQERIFWGLRSRHHDPAASAALFYEAETLTPLDAAATHAHAGASGGSTIRHPALPGGAWCPVLLTDILAGSQAWTHQGSYQIRARAYSATAVPDLRFLWGIGDVAQPITNEPVRLQGAGAFYIVDLGTVRLDAPPVGGYGWHGMIQARAAAQGDPIEIDCLYLQPLDEYAGECQAVQSTSPLGIEQQGYASTGADDSATGTLPWTIGNPAFASTTPSGGTTHYLKAEGFGFAIPTGATISGVAVEITHKAGTGAGVKDAAVRLVKAGAVQATDRAGSTPWNRFDDWETFAYGSQTDLWGAAWTPADINDPAFGVAVSALASPGGLSAGTIAVSVVKITVHYTTSGPFITIPDAVCYANHEAELRTDGMFRQDATGTVEGVIAQVTGDLPRVPPSGIERRKCELFIKASRGDDTLPDSGLDSLTATVIYRPTYLFPETGGS